MTIERTSSASRGFGAFAMTALLLWVACVSPAQGAAPAPADSTPNLSALDLEQLMQIQVVFAGSKHAQLPRAVPSFVSVVTAAEIKEHGFRTLADVLNTLPSFYVCNDRNYSYVGVRGFERPGDYSSRILLLLNGLRTNDNVYDQALVGEEFLVDVDLIDRIEVIRGPSAALYGSNAFFAVVNVVTKKGSSLQGGELATTAASFGTYAGRASYGRGIGRDLDLLVSASYSESKGRRLYFPEFHRPTMNNGLEAGADRESFHKLLANVDKGDFSLQVSNMSREKGIPTASFGTLFNDPRSRTVDGLTLTSLSYHRAPSEGSTISASVHGGRYTYTGDYPYDPLRRPNRDDNVGEWWGVDVDASRALWTRHVLTLGAEYQDNLEQYQRNADWDPYVLNIDLRNSSVRWGMFAQDELRLLDPLMLYAGVRYDRYETFGGTTSPRIGLIYTPGRATTVKLLAGRAFRAPNAYELFYEAQGYRGNPSLEPERIETLELLAQQLIGGGVQISASAFRNRLSALINQTQDASDPATIVFENAAEIESRGFELGLEVNPGRGLNGQLTYDMQRTEDRASGAELTNSPRHMAKLQVLAPLFGPRLTAGLDAQYSSSRRTLAGARAPGFVVTNLSFLAPRMFGSYAASVTVYNLLDAKCGIPGSEEHLQDIIQQDGRSFRVKATRSF